MHVEPNITSKTLLVLATQHLSTKESGSWISSLFQFSCVWHVCTCLHVGHMCVKEEMHMGTLRVEAQGWCWKPSSGALLHYSQRQGSQSSPALTLWPLLLASLICRAPACVSQGWTFQVEPHCPDNLCGFWRSKFPPSCSYSKCFNDRSTFLTFYRYFWSKVSSLHKGRTKKIWRINMGLPSQDSKLDKI